MPDLHLQAPIPPHRWHGSGEPLLLLAGLGGKGTSWRPYLRTAARRFSVLTLDSRGSGAAPDPDGPISIRDLARDVLALLDHLGLERVPVMGRSMGGMIAQELALMAPERVSSLVLVATTGRADAHVAEIFELWARMAELGVPAEIRHRSSMLWCLGGQTMEEGASARRYLEGRLTADRPLGYALQARACARHDALDRLGELRVPTLVVAGTDDRLTPPAHGRALAASIPGADLQLIPDAGHLVYLERPQAFARVVSEFLERDRSEPGLSPSRRIPNGGRRNAAAKQRREQPCPQSTKPW